MLEVKSNEDVCECAGEEEPACVEGAGLGEGVEEEVFVEEVEEGECEDGEAVDDGGDY